MLYVQNVFPLSVSSDGTMASVSPLKSPPLDLGDQKCNANLGLDKLYDAAFAPGKKKKTFVEQKH